MKRTFDSSQPETDTIPTAKNVQRRQEPVSCAFCRQKKLKCDRTAPCSNCRARKLKCSPSVGSGLASNQTSILASKTSELQSGEVVELSARVKKLEDLLVSKTATEEQIQTTTHSLKSNPKLKLAPNLNHGTPDELELSKTVEWLEKDVVAPDQQMSYPTSPIPNIAEGFRSFVFSIVRPPNTVILDQNAFSILPTRSQGRNLLDFFFLEINWMYHIVHAPTAQKNFETVYDSIEQGQQPNYAQLALLCAIFTLSAYFYPATSENEMERWNGHRWGALTRDLLSKSDCLVKPTIEALQSMIIIGQHIMPNVTGASMMRILAATEIQLARTLSIDQVDSLSSKRKRENFDVNWAEVEVKRRIWWHLVSTEWFMAFISGVPWPCGTYMVHAEQMNVDVPTNTNDVMINSDGSYAKPPEILTEETFQLFRIEISITFRQIVDATWKSGCDIDELPYEVVLDFDKTLNNLIGKLDRRLKAIEIESLRACGSEDKMGKARILKLITRQRNSNNFSIHTRLSRLHRPHLVRGAQDPRYAYSRMICLRSARIVIEVSKVLMAESKALDSLKLVAYSHHVFVSTVVLLMDYYFNRDEPRGKERKQEILDCFKILEGSTDQNTIAIRGLHRLQHVLRKRPESKDVGSEPASSFLPKGFNSAGKETQLPEQSQSYNQDIVESTPSLFEGPNAADPIGEPLLDMDFSLFDDINFGTDVDVNQFESFFMDIGGNNDTN